MINYCIALFPSKDVQDFANSYRKRYDPEYTLIQPHLLIMKDTVREISELDPIIRHLEQVAKEMAPFEVHFDRFSTLYPAKNVIILGVSDPEPLDECARKILKGISVHSQQTAPFTPFLTIGQGMSNDELQDVLSSFRKIPVQLFTRIDRIHLLYQTANRAWTAHQTFLLQGRQNE